MSTSNTIKVHSSSIQSELTGHIKTRWAGQPVCVYETIDSTNAEAVRLAEKGAVHGTVITADTQTAGRGRRGRSWESPAGDNLYFSLLLRPDIAPDKAPMLTLVMAVAAARAIGRITGQNPGIKWPNDLVMNKKKVCGILTEMRMLQSKIDHVIIGVGINVKDRIFSEELQDKATSLETVCRDSGKIVSREQLLAMILEEFESLYEAFVTAGNLTPLLDTYNQMLVNKDREVTVLDPQDAYNAVARGITATGELVVELPDGTQKEVFAGEVSVRGIYGYV